MLHRAHAACTSGGTERIAKETAETKAEIARRGKKAIEDKPRLKAQQGGDTQTPTLNAQEQH